MSAKLTETQIDNMRHALGLNRSPEPYRNHFIADIGSDDAKQWHELVDVGYAECSLYLLTPNSFWFSVTEAGRAALQKHNEPEVEP